MTFDLLECTICVKAEIVPHKLETHCICSRVLVPSVLLAAGSGLVLEGCWQCRQFPAGSGGVWGGGRPYGDFLMTHFLPPCCCTEAISRPPASPLCSIRQAEGGVFVCSRWFPHTPCCQDTERCRRADSYTGTLQDHCLARTLTWTLSHNIQRFMRVDVWIRVQGRWKKKGIHTENSSKLLHKWTHLCENVYIFSRANTCAIACALLQYIYSHASIYATVPIVLCTILSATGFLTKAQ